MKYFKYTLIATLISTITIYTINYLKIPIFSNYAAVTIINGSNQDINSFSISLSNYPDKKFYFNLIKKGENKTIEFKNFSDTHYIIRYKLNNKQISKEIGYLTNSLNYNNIIFINRDGNLTLENLNN